MIRGTTPTHIFTLPFEVSVIADLRVSYAQSDKEVLTKRYDDCVLLGNTVTVTLTQEDTFLFDCSKQVKVQMRVLTTDGEALSSAIQIISVEQCLNEEVLGRDT